MIRVCIVCEGSTEVEFIKSCITPYLLRNNINAYPVILHAPSGQHRGGRVTVERLAKFIAHQYHETDRITTLVDYYGFQNREERNRATLEQDIRAMVQQFAPKLNMHNVLPYVQMHEFEGLLFSDIEQFQLVLDGWNAQSRDGLLKVIQLFDSPENINDGPKTAPSKRILSIFKGSYSKVEHGPLIAEAIGIDVIRRKCPQFNVWLSQLQAWGC